MKPLKTLTNRLLKLSAALVATLSAHTAVAADTSYKADVQPIFDTYCVECHNANGVGTLASGLRLDSYEGVMAGTKHGKIIVPGDPLTSNLMAVLEGRTDASISMPHNDKRDMTKEDRRILRKWIVGGATKADYAGRPSQVIQELCLDCHIAGGSGYEASGLNMTTYESLMKGTKHGPIIVPGDPVTSNIMVLIEGRAAGGLKMPHNEQGEPNKAERKKLRSWIVQGAKNN
ncbi:c-type cytochrome domain-containing protein [Magnetovibrio sp. PR-2]|uniref:c-type cytochrome domain-containing protein n=1 Tax=Magnetovibrio sp. PR-2 TaxID=3120356 RepID=UPI002FCE62A9